MGTQEGRKKAVESTPNLDLRALRRGGDLLPCDHIVVESVGHTFDLDITEAAIIVSERVPGAAPEALALTHDRPTFGGKREFLVCAGCQNRVLRMFFVGTWCCRRCAGNLAYRSQTLTPVRAAALAVRRIRKMLDADTGSVVGGMPVRPPYMKWTRYRALLDRLGAAQVEHAAKLTEVSGSVGRRIDELKKRASGTEVDRCSASRRSENSRPPPPPCVAPGVI